MRLNINTSEIFHILVELNKNGFETLCVGGCVRDAILGLQPKDIDIEIYNISYTNLQTFLSKFGKTDLVGKQFGVIKFKPFESTQDYYDFSIPRLENASGTNHTDFEISFDVKTKYEAFLRRDFTINAIGHNPVTEELFDFFGGIKDLENKILRHTSDKFSEDALRIYRAMQFQSRFDLTIDSETVKLMSNMVSKGMLDTLSKERITEEWLKWAEKGIKPDLIFEFLQSTGIGEKYYPEVYLDENGIAKLYFLRMKRLFPNLKTEDKTILSFAILLYFNRDLNFLSQIGLSESLKTKIIKTLQNTYVPIDISNTVDEIEFGNAVLEERKKFCKYLSKTNHDDVYRVLTFLEISITDTKCEVINKFKNLITWAIQKFGENLEIKHLLSGKDLIEKGLTPGEQFGEILKKSYQLQLELVLETKEDILNWLNNYLND